MCGKICITELWSGLLFPPPRHLPNTGVEPTSPAAPALQVDSLSLSHWGSKICITNLTILAIFKVHSSVVLSTFKFSCHHHHQRRNFKIYLCITFVCAASSLLRLGFLLLQKAGAPL